MNSELQRRAILERVSRALDTLSTISTHPESLSDGANDLIIFAQASLQALVDAFATRWDQAAQLPEADADEERVRISARFSRVIRELESAVIPALEGAEARNIPFELEFHVQELARSLTPTWNITAIVLASEHRLNYSVGRYTTESWMKDIEFTDPVGPSMFLQFIIPRVARDSLLLHGLLIGHELGHLREWHSPILTDPKYSADQPNSYTSQAETSAEALNYRRIFQQIRTHWLTEIVADIYSAAFLGPAALFALQELSLTVGVAGDLGSHPGYERRIAIILRVLERLGFLAPDFVDASPLGAELASLSNVYGDSLAKPTVPPPAAQGVVSHMANAWISIHPRLDDLIEDCLKLPASLKFDVRRWGDVSRAADRLKKGLTSGEYRDGDALRPVPVATILNAGWYVKRWGLDELVRCIRTSGSDALASTLQANAALERLTLKSLEISSYRARAPWQ